MAGGEEAVRQAHSGALPDTWQQLPGAIVAAAAADGEAAPAAERPFAEALLFATAARVPLRNTHTTVAAEAQTLQTSGVANLLRMLSGQGLSLGRQSKKTETGGLLRNLQVFGPGPSATSPQNTQQAGPAQLTGLAFSQSQAALQGPASAACPALPALRDGESAADTSRQTVDDASRQLPAAEPEQGAASEVTGAQHVDKLESALRAKAGLKERVRDNGKTKTMKKSKSLKARPAAAPFPADREGQV